MQDILASLGKLSKTLWVTLGLALLGLVGLLDYLTGYELSFSLFYLLPIALVAWFASVRLGAVIAVASAGVWLMADILAGAHYSNPFIPVWNTAVRLSFFLLTMLLLRMGKGLEREKAFARSDYVTGAVNARFFHALAQREIDRSARYGSPLTMAYLDIDNFKTVNDRYGHMTGDKVLRAVAHGLRRNLRKTDIVARVGGDEFAILLPEVGSKVAQAVISKTQRKLLEDMEKNNWPVTFSIGVSTFTEAPSSTEEMLDAADNVMYTVKNNGKNNVSYQVHDSTGNSRSECRPGVSLNR